MRQLLHQIFGWYSFELTEVAKRINKIAERVLSISIKPPSSKVKAKSLSSNSPYSKATAVFTDNLDDRGAIGALCGFSSKRYSVKWMSPRQFLHEVDPYFKRHADEESMPWLLSQMKELIHDKQKGPKFSPLMMMPTTRRVFV